MCLTCGCGHTHEHTHDHSHEHDHGHAHEHTHENETVISASADEPVLVALERSGISAPSRCRSGECGWCRSKLISGEVYVPEENDDGRRWSDKENGYIHPCASFALSDLVLEVPGSYIK